MKVSITKKKILEVAGKEFLEKGFMKATLRDIVKKAGVTVGAFYGYYTSKEEIFEDLVKEAAEGLIIRHKACLSELKNYFIEGRLEDFDSGSLESFKSLYEYAHDHIDSFRLIIKCSAGTKYEKYIDNFSNCEIEKAREFGENFDKNDSGYKRISSITESILITSGLTAFFDLLLKDVSREESLKTAMELYNFFKAGWYSMLSLNNSSK